MIIGTAGHIDHGKSALVEALTGVHPDRLAEERRRGITLDLGFGHWLHDGHPVAVIDVPGHERLVRTMLAGAAGFDAVLLVVAADAGVQPQTREHLALCLLLGVRHAVVALTKRDLVDAAQAARVRAQIATLLADGGSSEEPRAPAGGPCRGSKPALQATNGSDPSKKWRATSPFAAAPILEVSALTRAGIEDLRAALVDAASHAAPRDAAAPFRLPLDRAFTMKGFGVVITGTLLQGTVRAGAEAELLPSAQRVRIRGLQVHGAVVPSAAAGQRLAVNLAGVELADLHRGLELVQLDRFTPTRVLDAAITWLPDTPLLPHRARCRLHLHTTECNATLLWLDAPRWAQLRLDQPILAVPGDRFILRRLSPASTLGGGVVLDAQPALYRRTDYTAAADHLSALDAAPDLAATLLEHLRVAGTRGWDLTALARALGHHPDELRAALLPAASAGQCVLLSHPPAAMSAAALSTIENRLLTALAAFHAREPMAPGAAADELALPHAPAWLAAAAQRLRAAHRLDVVAAGRWRLPAAAPSRSADQLALRQRLDDHFRSLGWSAPPLPQLLAAFPSPAARALVADLTRSGVLVECQPGWFLHASALERLRTLLTAHKTGAAAFSVPDFKQWTGLTRKLAIPLLEYCDRVRLTRRVGEKRIIL